MRPLPRSVRSSDCRTLSLATETTGRGEREPAQTTRETEERRAGSRQLTSAQERLLQILREQSGPRGSLRAQQHEQQQLADGGDVLQRHVAREAVGTEPVQAERGGRVSSNRLLRSKRVSASS